VARLNLAGVSGALDNINATQAEFRGQIAALNDLMRQVAGTANVAAGGSEMVDPLTAPFTLYVNPYIGQDTFAAGSYNTYELATGTDEEKIAAKLKRLDKQRLTCGFSPQRPFKTINRAVIEAAIITSKNWYTYTDPRAHLDCVSIVLAPGVHTVYNDPGVGTVTPNWADGYEPNATELIKFNPTTGGILLPRGCSLCGPDLRKCTFRPTWVPTNADELADRSNRSEIFKITGTGYFFGFTFMDKVGTTASHHLLSGFGFASKAELDAFYTKVRSSIGSGGNLSNALTVTRQTEYEIVGPIDDTPGSDWDTTQSASPYIFNCSVRSEYGMGGIHADGAKVTGLKSIVTANYTGVSLQKDMSCWELYSGSTWGTMPNYTTYISSDPNNVRMKPARRSYHIRAINNAFIQEVSVFAIGQGVHHSTESGGEITVTNSNSSFGGCVAIAQGYKTSSFATDVKWRFAYFKVPVNISDKTNNIQKYYLGKVGAYTDDQPYVDLAEPITAQDGSTTVPATLGQYGYTLRRGSYVWVENPNGNDYRVRLATTRDPWSTADSDRIYFVDGTSLQAFNDAEGSEQAPGTNNLGVNRAVGRRVYIRRLADTRSDSERKLTIGMFSIATPTRLAQRDYVLQLDPTAPVLAGDIPPYVNGRLPTSEPLSISSVLSTTISDASYGPTFTGQIKRSMEIQLTRNAPTVDYAVSTFYRQGTTVTYNDKHYTALRDQTTAASGGPTATDWQESYVHMPSAYRAGDKINYTSYSLVLDDDSSNNANSLTLGYDFSALWTDTTPSTVEKALHDQYRSSNDYLAAFALLRSLGFSEAASHAALQPRTAADRIRRVNNTTHFPTAPSGGLATARDCWAAEFRRPSVLRLFGHAFEWAGTLNYSKAFPAVQQELTALNKFNYYFTNELGGRAYATGFNEEGYLVKPTGIEDISTGESRSITSLATVDEDPINAFPSGIDVGGTSFFNDIEINGEVTFNYAATTDALGPVQLAGKQALQSDAYPGRGTTLTEAEFDAAINNGNQPEAVTLSGLNYWRDYHALLSAKALSFEVGTEADEIPVAGMLGRMAFVDEWCGYARGGGSVTQATSKSTGVTLNTPCGQITVNGTELAANTAVAFTLTNSQIAPQDVVVVSIQSGATAGAYAVSTLDITSGSVKIVIRNLTAGPLSQAVVLNFVIVKSTTTA
jgi:hypothetical protein